MYVEKAHIGVDSAEKKDAALVAELEERNKVFFQRFTELREESLHTYYYQFDEIKSFIQEAKENKVIYFSFIKENQMVALKNFLVLSL